MKKFLALLLVLTMILPCAMADSEFVYYQQHQSNGATFETLEEAHANASDWLKSEYPYKDYAPDTALDDYPVGTTYVYRAPGMYNYTSQAARMNTNILVYTDAAFASKDEAYQYLADMGLLEIIEEATGSIILVTPINAKSGFGLNDQYAFYLLQSVMCNIGAYVTVDGVRCTVADAGYYGGLTNRYLIGINGGATFVNNYIATTMDYVGRLAGMLLIGGTMEKVHQVAYSVPVWLINPTALTVERYKTANGTNSYGRDGDDEIYYNKEHPIQKVIVTEAEEVDLAAAVNAAYYEMFMFAMRVPVVQSNLYTASTLYPSYKFNQAPYSLAERNPFINGVTVDGIVMILRQEERFSDYKSVTGEYVTTWYELLPEEVLDGTAAEHSIPLLLCNHGGGDDPIQAVEEMGWLTVAGRERIAILAERHTTELTASATANGSPFSTMEQVLPPMVRYMLETYPALDPARVYVTGYSQGGGATVNAVYGDPTMFAAAVDMSGQFTCDPAKADRFENADIPIIFTANTYDTGTKWDAKLGHLVDGYTKLMNDFLTYNEIAPQELDFDKYEMSGIKGDTYFQYMINDEYPLNVWMFNNADGVPMVGMAIFEFLPHGLYPQYAEFCWDFFKHYSRNAETGAVIYDAYAK